MKDFFLTTVYLLLFNFLIYRFRIFQLKNFKPLVTNVIFNLKFAAGILIWFIYTFYYKDLRNNDIHKFYNNAIILHEAAEVNPKIFLQLLWNDNSRTIQNNELQHYTSRMKNWERHYDEAPFNENRTIISLNALLMFLSFKTYFVHILFFCFISLFGWVLVTNAVFNSVDARASILALPVLLLPSVLFWTSGIMKEPVLILGLGLAVSGISGLQFKDSQLKKNASFFTGSFIILMTKFFVLACLFPAVISFLFYRKNQNIKFTLLKYATVYLTLVLAAWNLHYIIPEMNFRQMLINKQTNSIREADYFKAGSKIKLPELRNDVGSLLSATSIGVWNSVTRPYICEARNILMYASAIENLFIVSWLLLCIHFINWKSLNSVNLFLFLLSFSIAYFALVGICTPVLGNLVRYKTPLLPLFMFAFISVTTPRAVSKNLTFLLRKETSQV